MQIDIDGPFFALNFFIVTYVKFYGLSYGQVLRLRKNADWPERTFTAIFNLKGHFGREIFFFKFFIRHLFSYANIIVGLKVDFTPGYDPTDRPIIFKAHDCDKRFIVKI